MYWLEFEIDWEQTTFGERMCYFAVSTGSSSSSKFISNKAQEYSITKYNLMIQSINAYCRWLPVKQMLIKLATRNI